MVSFGHTRRSSSLVRGLGESLASGGWFPGNGLDRKRGEVLSPVITTVELLRDAFVESSDRLDARLRGITDEEFFWEPCPGCWTLRRISESQLDARGEWQIDYADYGASPPPITTLAWRLIHIASGNWIYWEHAFGPGNRTFLDLEVPGTAGAAVTWWRASVEPWLEALKDLDDRDLDQLRATNWGEMWPTHRLVSTLIVEQTHHGAEIGLLRDLFRRRGDLGSSAR